MNKKTTMTISLILVFALIIPSFAISNKLFYQTAINYVTSHNYMSYSNGNFNGDKYVTRNELAQVIYNVKTNEENWINTTVKVLPNVVTIYANRIKYSGIALDKSHVLTCYHGYNSNVNITISNDYTTTSGKLIGYDILADLALIKLNEDLPNVIPLKLSTKAFQSQEVITIGTQVGSEKSVSIGIISKLIQDVSINKRMQLDMSVNNGNSGGAVFDINGDIVSVILSKINTDQGSGLSFGITQAELKEFLDMYYYN